MLKYINENDYTSLLGVPSVPADFNNLNIQASSYINHNTHGRIDINNIPEEVKYTTCLIIQLISEKDKKIGEIGNLKSQNIEGWSETYSTPEEIENDYDNKLKKVLSDYLWNVIGVDGLPLLYCGVR